MTLDCLIKENAKVVLNECHVHKKTKTIRIQTKDIALIKDYIFQSLLGYSNCYRYKMISSNDSFIILKTKGKSSLCSVDNQSMSRIELL